MELLRPRPVRNEEHRIPVDDLLAFCIAGDSPRLGPLAIGILREPDNVL
jgi:hypothetical protein